MARYGRALLALLCLFAAAADTSKASAGAGAGALLSRLEKDASLLKTGTTIVGVCCRDGVVLGADTRSTGGPLVIDKEKLKIHSVSSRIFCCAAGTSADCDQITRACGQVLALQRVEHELAGESHVLDSIFLAMSTIMDLFQMPVGNRMPESAIILGGVDRLVGPSLYQITRDGGLRTTFCALGSGSVDAISVLESARRKWGSPVSISFNDGLECLEQNVENVDTETAVEAVRRAVQAGILNDLGSGSHVDLCIIKLDGVRQWREKLRSAFDAEREAGRGQGGSEIVLPHNRRKLSPANPALGPSGLRVKQI